MSLDNIQLPSIVLQDLYKKTLVDLNNNKPAGTQIKKGSVSFLGDNEQNICIVVADENNLHLTDDLLNFLQGVLGACKLTMADIALVNTKKNNDITYEILQKELKAEVCLLFGVTPAQIHLPLTFPLYQIQKFNNQQYLAVLPLQQLQQDKAEKGKLWLCLKTIFNLG
jgi:hypothetical protein